MRFSFALLALLLVLPALSLAQDVEPRTFGIAATTFVALSAWDFVPRDSTVTFQVNAPNNINAISRTNNAGSVSVIAPLHLPDGALVTEMEAVFCDTSATQGFESFLGVEGRLASELFTLGPRSTAGEVLPCPSARTTVLGTPVQIDNKNKAYFIFVNLNTSDTSIQLASMRVGYVLQVSPAPATATFNDVPTSHPFFQFIEALAAAGITGGCSTTPPLYCPDAQVTRGQMAAFISRALGLQFAP